MTSTKCSTVSPLADDFDSCDYCISWRQYGVLHDLDVLARQRSETGDGEKPTGTE
jgi:hypothetical protein